MPPQQLDVYRDWLQIKETNRPLNHYQLLRLKPFDDDTARIRDHFRKMTAHVRKKGDETSESARAAELVQELTRAMLTLCDTRRKADYDQRLGRKEAADVRTQSFEAAIVARKLVEPEQLERARKFAGVVGVEIRDAVIQQKMAAPDAVMQVYAESLGLPFVEPADIEIDAALLPVVPAVLARQHSLAPLVEDDGQVIVASPNPLTPELEEQLRLRFNKPIRAAICTPAAINTLINKHYPREAAVAEMGTAAPAAASASSTAATQAGAKAAPAKTYAERRKHKLQVTFVAAVAGFAGVSVIGSFTAWGTANTMMLYVVAAVVGAIGAAVGWFLAD